MHSEYIMIYYRGTNDAWCAHDLQGLGYYIVCIMLCNIIMHTTHD